MSGTSLSDLSVCPVSCEWSVPWSTRFRPKVKNYKVETDPLRARVMAALAAAPAGGGANLASTFGADSLMVAANGVEHSRREMVYHSVRCEGDGLY